VQLLDDEHAATQARRLARRWASDAGVSGRVLSDLELVVTELVSNAIRHGLPPYELELRLIAGAIRVEVSDALPLRAQPRTPPEPDGFGLGIVNACASHWGADALPTGKLVWVEIKR